MNIDQIYHSFDDFSEDDVFTIQPRRFFRRYEKLRTIRIFARICHTQPTGAIMLQFEIFVGKFITVNASTWKINTNGRNLNQICFKLRFAKR